MNVSTEAVAEFLSARGLDTALAPALVEHLRADETRRGQNQTDTRNIHDWLKSLSTEEIKHDLIEQQSSLVPIFLNVVGDFNLSSGIRNTNWFNTGNPWIIGRKKWDRRGAVGTQNYTNIRYSDNIHLVIDVFKKTLDYTIVAAEISDVSVPLTTFEWPENSVIIFGEEGAGVPEDVLDKCDHIVHIPGRGSVRSINVAACAATFMYDYSNKRGLLNG